MIEHRSGRPLVSAAEVVRKRLRPRKLKATLVVSGQSVATIESQWVSSELEGAVRVRHTEVMFTDGAAWRIDTSPPDSPPEPRVSRRGRVKPGTHLLVDRLVRVADERGREIAIAEWPEPDPAEESAPEESQEQELLEASQARAIQRKAALDGLIARNPHRRGRAKWLLVAGMALLFVNGFLPAAIVSFASGEVGLGIAFGIIVIGAFAVGFPALRRWRDAGTCWSCGRPITGKPADCPYCAASKPFSSGLRARFSPLPADPQRVSQKLIEKVPKLLGVEAERVTQVRFGAETHALEEHPNPAQLVSEWRLGEILTITSKLGNVTLTPHRSVPMVAALLCWHIAIGDFWEPSGK